jgi:ribosomal protein S17
MNNTRTLAVVAVLMAATLVVGTFVTVATTQSAYAYAKKSRQDDNKKTRDNGSGNRNGNTVTIEECKNRGSASGFDTALDQECENVICTHPGNNATCVQEGVVTPTTPVKLTCEQCFTKFLSSTQISLLLQEANVPTLERLCAVLPEIATAADLLSFLVGGLKLSNSEAIQLVQCLLDAGIVFPTVIDDVRTLR